MMPSRYHRLPAEFEQQACIYLLWPLRHDNWRDHASLAQAAILDLANILAQTEHVKLCSSTELSDEIRQKLDPRIVTLRLSYDDIWVRDTGPNILISGSGPPIAINWSFNSWGGLFADYLEDDEVASRIACIEHIESVQAPMVLEGGAIITDGRGTLIATKESILTENRNPGLNLHEAETILRRYLNVQEVIWLETGLADDEAGGHIDNVCIFADDRTLLVAHTEDSDHPSFDRLKEGQARLKRSVSAQGNPFELVLLPLPPPMHISEEEAAGFAAPSGQISRTPGTPLAPSHVNMCIANKVVVLPTFGVDTDVAALEVACRVFSNKRVVPFPCHEFVLGGGGVHCLTREIPRTKATGWRTK